MAGIFQREMEKCLSHIPSIVLGMDDILISRKNDNKQYFRHCVKCGFMASEVTYSGFRIDKKGVNPVSEKVAGLLNAETPKNTIELKSFLGM